jgi:acetyl esterase/lipase
MPKQLPILPGRLGSPGIALQDDPRADPRMLAAMAPFGLAAQSPSAIDGNSPMETILESCAALEVGFETVVKSLTARIQPPDNVEHAVTVIPGTDGNEVTLYIHRPSGISDRVPGVLHLHGGGMVVFEAAGPGYVAWRDALASTGLVVVGVEFRNGAGKRGAHPFPAGLNDCISALQWVSNQRKQLMISKLIVSGESGGGNLALATALQSKRLNTLAHLDGVYAQCPQISNAYLAGDQRLPSLSENDGYVLSSKQLSALARAYDPTGENATNPLAWPYHAEPDDLRGLPPHVISLNELDPLRDEGLQYFRKLLLAEVSAISRTVNGTCHAGDCLFREAMPDVYMTTIRDIKAFADSL